MPAKEQPEDVKQEHDADKEPHEENREPHARAEKDIKTDRGGTNKKDAFDWKEVAEDVAGKSGEALKTSAEKLGEFVKVGAEKVGDFTSHTTNLAKLKLEEHRLNAELNDHFQTIGEKLWGLYHTHKLTDVETSFSEDLEKISKIDEALKKNRKNQK